MRPLGFLPVIVVDGLNECDNHNTRQQILCLFIDTIRENQLPIHLLIRQGRIYGSSLRRSKRRPPVVHWFTGTLCRSLGVQRYQNFPLGQILHDSF
ncbi:hypothetical protein DFH09DRAFT_900103 [Mycena vulgaris]|nr:hypothetical protein DFH09DRAFT_900103 [Mycena vulgaris]